MTASWEACHGNENDCQIIYHGLLRTFLAKLVITRGFKLTFEFFFVVHKFQFVGGRDVRTNLVSIAFHALLAQLTLVHRNVRFVSGKITRLAVVFMPPMLYKMIAAVIGTRAVYERAIEGAAIEPRTRFRQEPARSFSFDPSVLRFLGMGFVSSFRRRFAPGL